MPHASCLQEAVYSCPFTHMATITSSWVVLWLTWVLLLQCTREFQSFEYYIQEIQLGYTLKEVKKKGEGVGDNIRDKINLFWGNSLCSSIFTLFSGFLLISGRRFEQSWYLEMLNCTLDIICNTHSGTLAFMLTGATSVYVSPQRCVVCLCWEILGYFYS